MAATLPGRHGTRPPAQKVLLDGACIDRDQGLDHPGRDHAVLGTFGVQLARVVRPENWHSSGKMYLHTGESWEGGVSWSVCGAVTTVRDSAERTREPRLQIELCAETGTNWTDAATVTSPSDRHRIMVTPKPVVHVSSTPVEFVYKKLVEL